MKKLICFVLVALCCCLTACNFTQNVSGPLANATEATPGVEQMLNALAENNVSDAEALMHPDAAKKANSGVAQMITYLAGRKATEVQLQDVNINTSAGTSGKVRQEQVTYQVTLEDGESVYISAVYLSDKNGTGFVSFQLVLGMV